MPSPFLMIKHRAALLMARGVNVPFHLLFNEPWDAAFWSEYRRARTYFRAIERDQVRRVFIISYSRSGTHNFYTHFHYHPAVFAFGENIYTDMERDPYQFAWSWERVSAPHFQYGSAFLAQGLQEKNGADLTHVFLLANHFLKARPAIAPEVLRPDDRVVFYQRNFIRTLYSMDQDGRKRGKQHFMMTDDNFTLAVHRHRRKLEEMLRLTEADPVRFNFCFHELFCAHPEREVVRVAGAVDLALPDDPSWMDPLTFFRRCYRSGEAPVLRDGRLVCPVSGEFIHGKGGYYNPVPPVSLKRTLSDPVETWLDANRLSLVRSIFGAELVDFWLSDAGYAYDQADTTAMTALFRRSLARAEGL
jgi:hypothetical protein